MKGYNKIALKEFVHETPLKLVHGPTLHTPASCGKQTQLAKHPSERTNTEKQLCHHQEVCGKFLHASREVNNMMAHALNEARIIATPGNDLTAKELTILVDYIVTYPDAQLMFCASDMIMIVDSDAAHLVMSQARSRASGFFCLGNKNGNLFSLRNNSLRIFLQIFSARLIFRH